MENSLSGYYAAIKILVLKTMWQSGGNVWFNKPQKAAYKIICVLQFQACKYVPEKRLDLENVLCLNYTFLIYAHFFNNEDIFISNWKKTKD